MQQEDWYEIQFSVRGADDWFTLGQKYNYDSLESAKRGLSDNHLAERRSEYDLRIVRKTLTEEVVR